MAALSLFLSLSLLFALSSAHNITDILSSEPDLSQFNDYLSRTKLADEINSRETITVLALSNSAMSSLSSKPLSVVKNILSLHVLLDYYDPQKLHSLHDGTVDVTTLYQTTGSASGSEGRVNITDLKGGSVGFGSMEPGSKPNSTYTKSVKQIPYNISVIEISAPIVAPSLLTAPPPSSSVNVTALLEKAGCKTFATLISSSGVLNFYEDQMDKGLTVFAPNDEAFKAKGLPDLSKLSNAALVSLLQFHALTTYSPTATLKTTKGSLPTLAGSGKFDLKATSSGDSVTLNTSVDKSRVASVVLDSTPVIIYSVDAVLLPQQLFASSPSPAPAPSSPSPAPAPSPKAKSPAPTSSPLASPPAPPSDTPASSPSDSPADSPDQPQDVNSKNNFGVKTTASALLLPVAVSVASCVISSVL